MASEVEIRPLRYNTVAASQTAQALIGEALTGAKNDILDSLMITPATTSPGAVSLTDGTTTISVFVGGATSVNDLKPFPWFGGSSGIRSQNGPWKVTTGANVSVVALGRFT